MAVKDFTAGQVLTATEVDQFLNNSKTPRLAVKRTAVQSIADSTWATVTWQTADMEQVGETGGDMWSSVTNPTRLIAPRTGDYMVLASARFASGATGSRSLQLRKNAAGAVAAGVAFEFASVPGSASNGTHVSAGGLIALTANDYLEVFVWQNSGAALDVVETGGTRASLYLVGDS